MSIIARSIRQIYLNFSMSMQNSIFVWILQKYLLEVFQKFYTKFKNQTARRTYKVILTIVRGCLYFKLADTKNYLLI